MNNPITPTDDSTQAVLEHPDPATLVIDTNVRSDPRLDPHFVASIRERGVLFDSDEDISDALTAERARP